jgi:hypothetical protein
MKANNKSGNATMEEQWFHLFCYFFSFKIASGQSNQ